MALSDGEAADREPALTASGGETAPGKATEASLYRLIRRGRDRLLAPPAALLAALGVPAAAVSLTGPVLAASLFMTLPARPGWAVGGLVAALGCDALDGAVARRLGSSSMRGKLLDQLCDSATYALALAAAAHHGTAPAGAAAFGAWVVLLLAALAIARSVARGRDADRRAGRPAEPPSRHALRGGFAAHLPKAFFYAALLTSLFGGPDWVGPGLWLSNLLASATAVAIGRELWLRLR